MTETDWAETALHIPLGMLNDLVAADSTKGILDCMSKWSGHLLDARHCVVALAHEQDSLRVTSFAGATISGADVIVPAAASFLGTAYLNGRTNILRDVTSTDHPMREKFMAGGIDTLIVTPITTQGRCFGTFGVGLGPEFTDLPRVTGFLETLARCLANQLLIVDQIERLNHLTQIDPLTESFNRRYLAVQATDMWQAWQTAGMPFGMIAIDLDHFKKINDTYGHDAGDIVLQVVARRIRGMTREGDSLVRMGGEEFCLMICDATRARVNLMSRRIWRTIRASPVTTDSNTIAVTTSVGFAVVNQTDKSHQTLLKRADAALYRAKETGRDKVCAG